MLLLTARSSACTKIIFLPKNKKIILFNFFYSFIALSAREVLYSEPSRVSFSLLMLVEPYPEGNFTGNLLFPSIKVEIPKSNIGRAASLHTGPACSIYRQGGQGDAHNAHMVTWIPISDQNMAP
jgi:hypothetical protein